jgi:hypothetical protein
MIETQSGNASWWSRIQSPHVVSLTWRAPTPAALPASTKRARPLIVNSSSSSRTAGPRTAPLTACTRVAPLDDLGSGG